MRQQIKRPIGAALEQWPSPALPVQAKTKAASFESQGYRLGFSRHSLANISISAESETTESVREPLARSNGKPLPNRVRKKMERSLGHNFGGVRIHEDASAAAIGAVAYAQERHIHFAPGMYRPNSSEGKKLLGHELAHVKQQDSGRVSRPTGHDDLVNRSTSLEAEADSLGARAANGMASAEVPGQLSLNHSGSLAAPASAPIQANGGKTPAVKPTRPGPYTIGSHGYKKKEQQELSTKYGINVSGATHESEHTIGFEPLNQTSGEKRGKGTRARKLENTAPAYQEVKDFHRSHIGTGSHGTADESGFTSTGYREAQRNLLTSGDVSSAVQLNQLGYAFNPVFQSSSKTKEREAADESFARMVGNMNTFTYAQGQQDVDVPVDEFQREEMLLSRMFAEKGWDADEVVKARNKLWDS